MKKLETEMSPKEKLLFAALDLFSQKGYSATSVDEIAESIGIKGPNIYKYFKGKEGILKELTSLADRAYMKGMGFDDNIVNSINSVEDLREYSIRQIRFTVENDTIRKLRKMCTIEQFRDEKIGEQATVHQVRNISEFFAKVFDHLMKCGLIKKADPKLLALDYASPTSILIQLCDRDYDNKERYIELMIRHIDFFIETYSL